MTLHEICTKYYNVVYRRCSYELNFNADAAAEVTQQVFLVLCEKWPLVQFHPNLEGWLLKVTSNKLKKARAGYVRRSQIMSTSAEEFREPMREDDIFSRIMCEQLEIDLERYANEVLSQLSENEVILAGYIREKKTNAEIAELLEITKGAASMRVSRLYKKVRGIVQEIVDNVV